MRNIVLVTIDSLRADHCSFMGYERKTTPTMDKMAKKGLYFENAIAPGTDTPHSMTEIFTGQSVSIPAGEINPSLWKNTFKKRKSLAEKLSELGYSTGAIHPNPFASSFYGFDTGFDHFQDFLFNNKDSSFASKIWTKIFDRVTSKGKQGIFSQIRNIYDLIFREGSFRDWTSSYQAILEWIKNANDPFFIWILLLDTHHFYLAPRKFRKWSNLFDMWYFNWKLQNVNWEPKLSQNEKEQLINSYDDSIRYADRFLLKLWKDIKNRDPIFIVHADHGEGFGEHGFYGHQPFLYEETIHVPLIIYNLGRKGSKIERPVSLRGITPTILDLIGKEENGFPAQSLLKSKDDWVISQLVQEGIRKIAVRMRKWKYKKTKDKEELYNLKKDPDETENLSNDLPKLTQGMREIARNKMKENEKKRIRKNISDLKTLK